MKKRLEFLVNGEEIDTLIGDKFTPEIEETERGFNIRIPGVDHKGLNCFCDYTFVDRSELEAYMTGFVDGVLLRPRNEDEEAA